MLEDTQEELAAVAEDVEDSSEPTGLKKMEALLPRSLSTPGDM